MSPKLKSHATTSGSAKLSKASPSPSTSQRYARESNRSTRSKRNTVFNRGPVYEFVCVSFRTDNLEHGNAARNPIRDVETFVTDHNKKRRFRHSAIYQTIKGLANLRCLYGSETVLLGGGHW